MRSRIKTRPQKIGERFKVKGFIPPVKLQAIAEERTLGDAGGLYPFRCSSGSRGIVGSFLLHARIERCDRFAEPTEDQSCSGGRSR